VTVLDHGQVRFCGSVDEMRSGSRHVISLHTSDDEGAARLARQ